MTESYTLPQKLAIINDLSGYGRCSLTVALPVVSAMKVQGCPVPTSYFSNHMGYPAYFSKDLSGDLPAYLEKWEELQLIFDGIYCGFLNSEEQVFHISTFIRHQKQKNPDCRILIDPVMGDHGTPYRSVTQGFCNRLKELVSHADIVTPNLTEACLLTDTPYDANIKAPDLNTLGKKLQHMGAGKIVITGIFTQGQIGNYIYESDTKNTLLYQPMTGESRPGTGDLFASILAAAALKEQDFEDSVKKAAAFVSRCTDASHTLGIPVRDGVCFENFLSELM